MYPPPQTEPKTSAAHRWALWSILAPLIAVGVALGTSAAAKSLPSIVLIVASLVNIVLIIVGFIAGIVGLCGMREHGTRGLLAKSIVGLVISGFLLICCVVAAANSLKKGPLSNSAAQNSQADAGRHDNSENGNENDKAASTALDDNALAAQAFKDVEANEHSAEQNFYDALNELKAVRVFSPSNLTSQANIISGRRVVQKFVKANADMKYTITNADTFLRADMARLNVSPEKIQSEMATFDSAYTAGRDLNVQIRDCTDRSGEAMLANLDLLNTEWGHWHVDRYSQRLEFNYNADQQAYDKSIETIQANSREITTLQKQIKKQP